MEFWPAGRAMPRQEAATIQAASRRLQNAFKHMQKEKRTPQQRLIRQRSRNHERQQNLLEVAFIIFIMCSPHSQEAMTFLALHTGPLDEERRPEHEQQFWAFASVLVLLSEGVTSLAALHYSRNVPFAFRRRGHGPVPRWWRQGPRQCLFPAHCTDHGQDPDTRRW